MSERQHSKAAVVRVKGVSFNYLQFLWSGIGQVRQQQSQGNFSGAMGLVASFIPYLPDSIKDKFRAEANAITANMTMIQAGQLAEIRAIPDFYLRGIYRNKLLQIYSSKSLEGFVDELSSALNQLGYMENLKIVAEGEADENVDWLELDKKRKKAEKKSKKRETSPQGSLD